MAKLNDKLICSWIMRGEHFDQRSDGAGLTLCFRESFVLPVWRLRYTVAGKQKIMTIGSYRDLGLAEARKIAKELRATCGQGVCPWE